MKGIVASEGLAVGRIFRVEEAQVVKPFFTTEEHELTRLRNAALLSIDQLTQIRNHVMDHLGKEEALVFSAHIEILKDPVMMEEICQLIRKDVVAEEAVDEIIRNYVELFLSMEDEYMRLRSSDIRDVGKRMLNNLQNFGKNLFSGMEPNSIVVAHDLSPSETAQLPLDKTVGFITEIGGRTSHTSIFARNLGIPALVGVNGAMKLPNNTLMFLNAIEGEVVRILPGELDFYLTRIREHEKKNRELEDTKFLPAVTTDNHRVEVAANIGSPREAEIAVRSGAEGVGLFRTEFLFMERTGFPDEAEQFEVYSEVARSMGERPVIVRLLDIGVDKRLSYYKMPDEMNPLLGKRAMRLLLEHHEILETQLKAILRTSLTGNVKVMLPMIATVEEIRAARNIIDGIIAEMKNEGAAEELQIEIGITVEVPSVAISPDLFVDEVDFFSIGSNDLIQYTFAADRMNQDVSYLYQPCHPSILRMVKNVIDIAHDKGKWAGVCGEMAGDPVTAPLLLGMGLDEFSMSIASIPRIKYLIRHLSLKECRELVEESFRLKTHAEVDALVRNFLQQKKIAL
ncbi:phosphoenolpyruvate--protein phosphotransferase [Ferviditalea candida]|uniref:Phosphoenolpyruvate-protein phosphotransferase n=1 Tax=Ferviditalea candida TaxID=3108399 RepID=A0ABU5ZLN4_9BACL|nr:phosphoenolpyruvate--protein phosphotransferase [Paenibacillaceae bacterium T2]